jgi:hypothetical protein
MLSQDLTLVFTIWASKICLDTIEGCKGGRDMRNEDKNSVSRAC